MISFNKLKYHFIRTPLEQPLMRLRKALGYFSRRRFPELREIYLEDERIESVLKRILRADSNCIDVGCHYGSMLSRICSLAPRGKHIAVEAIPTKVRFLRAKFPDVEIIESALSDSTGTTQFYINTRATGFSGLHHHGEGQFEKIEVSCARLDDLVPQTRRFDFLKVDVEGAELLVFRGAVQFLRRDRPAVLFECGPSGPQAFGYQAGELHDFFTSIGYSVFHLRDAVSGGPPVDREDFESALVYPFTAFNWLALANPA